MNKNTISVIWTAINEHLINFINDFVKDRKSLYILTPKMTSKNSLSSLKYAFTKLLSTPIIM